METRFSFTNKQFLLAGSNNEVGRSLTDLLKESGARLVLLDKNTDEYSRYLAKIQDKNVIYYDIDLNKIEQIEPGLKRIFKETGIFDGFAFCAGEGGLRPLSLTKPQYTQQMMNANFFPFVELVRVLSGTKALAKGSGIVAVSSISSFKGMKSKLAYSSSKAALDAAIRNLAVELADKSIRVNSIQKGVLTTDSEISYIKAASTMSDEIHSKNALNETEPMEIASFIAYMLSDSTRSLTGTSVVIDGGYSF